MGIFYSSKGIKATALNFSISKTDGRPIYQPIKCQILALFSSPDKKINYNYLATVNFLGFGNRPMVG